MLHYSCMIDGQPRSTKKDFIFVVNLSFNCRHILIFGKENSSGVLDLIDKSFLAALAALYLPLFQTTSIIFIQPPYFIYNLQVF